MEISHTQATAALRLSNGAAKGEIEISVGGVKASHRWENPGEAVHLIEVLKAGRCAEQS
jgi:hypothetical protein